MIKAVVLIVFWVLNDMSGLGGPSHVHVAIRPLPPGTTIADCEEDHQTAMDNILPDEAIKAGYKCAEADLVPVSGA